MNKTSRNDSLNKRYSYKLVTNLIGFVVSFIYQAIITRGLGPARYGDYNFLTNFFSQVVGFGDGGTSTCFYTKLSQRSREPELVSFYFYIVSVVSFAILIFVIIATATPAHFIFWPGQRFLYIYLAAGVGISIWITQLLNNMTDSYGVTVSAEIAKVIQKLLALCVIILIFVFRQLNLDSLFYYQYLNLFLLAAVLIGVMRNNGYLLMQTLMMSAEKFKLYFKEFYDYSHPLFIYSLVGMLVNIMDRWLLQIFGGSFQQGFYSLAYQIGAACFLFTGAMTSLLTREFSIAFGKSDIGKMSVLFRRYVPLLASITVYFTCFIAAETDKVASILGGGKYKEATLAIVIMSFYPIYQVYGQLSGAIFMASNQTKLYRNLGVLFLIVGLPVTYFLIAPIEKLGLNAGATGLAIKMVGIQFVGVNCMLYFNARFLRLSFWKYFVHQIANIGFFLILAFFATFAIDRIMFPQSTMIFKLFFSGVIYTLMVIIFGYFFPLLYGLDKNDVGNIINKIVYLFDRGLGSFR